jgi:putative SOS response-associated peptidase YedK
VVLTKEPTAELSKIHDRMPLMLPKDRIDEWISPASDPAEIVPFALSDMVMEKAGVF